MIGLSENFCFRLARKCISLRPGLCDQDLILD